jgi:phage-related protein (TIGR01555 family)
VATRKQRRSTSQGVTPKAVDDQPVLQQDAFSNPAARLGFGTLNLTESAHYALTRLSYDISTLLSLYRGNWIARKVIDAPAEDMLKNWIRLTSQVTPQQIDQFDRVTKKTFLPAKLQEAVQWGRLLGGAGAVMVIRGHEDIRYLVPQLLHYLVSG